MIIFNNLNNFKALNSFNIECSDSILIKLNNEIYEFN